MQSNAMRKISGTALSIAGVVFNATEINGKCAEAAILAKQSYTGICFTEFHAKELKKLLVRFVWDQFKDQSSPFYYVEVRLGYNQTFYEDILMPCTACMFV